MGGLRPWFFLLGLLCSLCPSQLEIRLKQDGKSNGNPSENVTQATIKITTLTTKKSTSEATTTSTTKKSSKPSSTPTTSKTATRTTTTPKTTTPKKTTPKTTTPKTTTTKTTTTKTTTTKTTTTKRKTPKGTTHETNTPEKLSTTTRQWTTTEKATTEKETEVLSSGILVAIVVGFLLLIGAAIVVCLILRRKKKFPFAPKKKPEETEINKTEEDVPLDSASVETTPAYNEPGLPPLLKDVPRPAGAQETRDQFKFDTMKQKSEEAIGRDANRIVEMSEQSPALVQSTNTESPTPEDFRIVSTVDVFNISEHDSGRRRLFPPAQPVPILFQAPETPNL